MKVSIPCRLAFPQLWKAESINDGEPRFGAVAIIDPEDPVVDKLRAAVKEVAKAKWADKAPAILKKLYEDNRVCFKEGPKTNSSGDIYTGFEDMFHLNASNPTRPLVIARDKSPLTEQDGKPYAGCHVIMSVELWAQDNKFGKRVNATLRGVQFVKDGDAFTGGAPASVDEFEDLGVEDLEEDLA